MKNMIVNADDFGLTEGINNGIVDGFKNGIITSASLMATMPAFEHAVELATEHPGLDIGAHVSLTLGKPCSLNNKLWPILGEGEFIRSLGRLTWCVYAGRIHPRDIKEEISAQIKKIQETGLKITHLDGHQHIHMLPCLLEAITVSMREYQIPFIRIPDEAAWPKKPDTIKGWGLFFMSLFSKFFRKKIAGTGLKTADHFFGLSRTEKMSMDDLIYVLNSSKPGINELMCHPGYKDACFSLICKAPFLREEELAALTSREASDFIIKNGIKLTGYKELLNL